MGGEEGGRRLYGVLGLDRGATAADVRKAYRKLAVQHHPDKAGGDLERFKEIAHAYEVLGDDEKRRSYDAHGDGGPALASADAMDIFKLFFGGGGQSSPGPSFHRRRTRDIVHALSVSLEQLYLGCTRRLAVQRSVVDETGELQPCEQCGGSGVWALGAPHGPRPCATCAGAGRHRALRRVREVVEVHVEKGAPHGHRIVLARRADEHPGLEPGDLVFVLHQQEHPQFRRRGADLFLSREISLLEALSGFRMLITHLDKRDFVVQAGGGRPVRLLAEGTGLLAVQGEGMPTHGSPFLFGALFVVLKVHFPDAIDPAATPLLRRALPVPLDEVGEEEEGGLGPAAAAGAEVTECVLEDLDPGEPPRAGAPAGEGQGRGGERGGPGARPPGCPLQ